MPELPEVETICRSLRTLLPGRRVVVVEVLEPRLRSPVSEDFRSELQGRVILDVKRRGKYILVLLEGGRVWVSHLGMSGKLIYVGAGRPREKHDHIIIRLDEGHELRYHDPRRFGLSFVAAYAEFESLPQIRNLGLDPFDRQFNGVYLYSVARNSRRRIRDLLIDQRVLAGLGNIYANEILFHAGVRPTMRGWRLGRRGTAQIAEATPKVLLEAIRWRGTSFSDYRDGEDRRGEFQNHLRVYDRDGEECTVCTSKIRKVRMGNRSAFYCPSCQK
ncbi:MAG: bifunctional DNA-formamidopyrimidine glycosylase/DNA-(apurinic or apyrimidinic site) lyase [Deltaproteobacteria bacterium]|nr:bifunctional DNA-formamidopyrimidine glycosylase/DNA-(apurinic or apyrimidinic site) lyase [Deltaproteobacteria bacterium]